MAVITEIEGEHCTIHELQLSGQVYGGQGAVELACLEKPKASAPWRAAHAVYLNHIVQQDIANAEAEQENEDNRKKRRRATKLVAEKHGLDPKTLRTIIKDLQAAGVVYIYE